MNSFVIIRECDHPCRSSTQDAGDIALLRVCSRREDPTRSWVNTAAQLLIKQWPNGGPLEAYESKVVHDYDSSCDHYGLPCSYLLVKGLKSSLSNAAVIG